MGNIASVEGALQALQYHKINKSFIPDENVFDFVIESLEEFRELKEKATAKAPYLFGDGYSDGVPVYDEWNCPNCDTNYEVDFEHYDYCPMCGQHIDWSEGKG